MTLAGVLTKEVGGVTFDNNGRIRGETPLKNVDFEVYSTLSGVGGITRGAVGMAARTIAAKK